MENPLRHPAGRALRPRGLSRRAFLKGTAALAAAAREAGPLAKRLAGPGLKDMTRLVQFPFDVQGEVSRRNARLPQAAARLSSHLARVLEGIVTSPEDARVALEEARAAREALYPTAQEGSA